MKCPDIEKLIPLYAGGDLDPKHTRIVEQHLDSCENCRNQARGFEQSALWLKSNASPEFDDATFLQLRQAVRSEIARIQTKPGFGDLIFSLWPLRPAPALSVAAIIILIAALSLIIFRSSTDKNSNLITAVSNPAINRQEEPAPTDALQAAPKAALRKPRKTIARKEERLAINQIGSSAPTDITSSKVEEKTETISSNEMLRIELQTADPNIRIIWFTPKKETQNDSK
jgi:hypothetical protein